MVPKGKRWTSGFNTCAGGYLRGNHITLLGLTRLTEHDLPIGRSDWTTAMNIRFQRTSAIKHILACDGHGEIPVAIRQQRTQQQALLQLHILDRLRTLTEASKTSQLLITTPAFSFQGGIPHKIWMLAMAIVISFQYVPAYLQETWRATSADAILHTKSKQRPADVMFDVCHAGYHRDRVLETIVQTKLTVLDQSLRLDDPIVHTLFSAEGYGKDCTILAQHLEGVARFAYIPECKDILPMPPVFAKMLKGKLEVIQNHQTRLRFRQALNGISSVWAHLVALVVRRIMFYYT